MAETSPQWGDRTVQMPPQDPWAAPAATPGPSQEYAFQRGVAHVSPAQPRTEAFTAAHEPTGTGWPDADLPSHRPSVGEQLRQLRAGGEWTSAAALFALVCWGIWTLSSDGDGFATQVLVLALSLLVAGGLFALTRVLGRVVLERQLGRRRRSARGAHLVAAAFLVGVGITHLQQTDWVVQAWNWVAGTF